MKAGTTSLYRDLETNPAIFMPYRKEPSHLARDEVLTPAGRREFARFFERAAPDQLVGVASTQYAKLPDLPGVTERALKVIGPDIKAIYLVRHPVARIVSHHYHEWSAGTISCGIDAAVAEYPRFLDYTRYAMQITPWLEALGPDRVLILKFESYIKDRLETVDRVCRFLGVRPQTQHVRADKVYNKSEGKPILRGPLALVRNSGIYQNLVSPYLPLALKERLRSALLPKAPPRPGPPSPETVRRIVAELADDVRQLGRLMASREPLWDFDADRQPSRA